MGLIALLHGTVVKSRLSEARPFEFRYQLYLSVPWPGGPFLPSLSINVFLVK